MLDSPMVVSNDATDNMVGFLLTMYKQVSKCLLQKSMLAVVQVTNEQQFASP